MAAGRRLRLLRGTLIVELREFKCGPSPEMDSIVGVAEAAQLHTYHQHVDSVLHIDSGDGSDPTAFGLQSPFSSQQVQHLGFNKESQRFEADGIDDDLFQAFLNFGALIDKVKTEDEERFVVDYTSENFGMAKVSKSMQCTLLC
ncbi:hypothetical protein TSMEX_007650 [Taenia solium]|eukprot:TsM_001192500 transcript=TsM_001192500 gene=TsM_001192500